MRAALKHNMESTNKKKLVELKEETSSENEDDEESGENEGASESSEKEVKIPIH